jgi:CheY-like chemotaxis protein
MKHVMIVEDDEDIRNVLGEILTSVGMTSVTAANGEIGLSYLRTTQKLPDLILLDILMPVKDGYQFRAEQLADDRIKNIPVIVMTAFLGGDTSKMRAAAVVRKPVDIESLIDLIKQI